MAYFVNNEHYMTVYNGYDALESIIFLVDVVCYNLLMTNFI
jgi:hypothetical protein